ncbi:MotA/TolQ/ExbB proton channel family protein [Coraliomargarita sp. SDUM461003]|uniref:MotA/TolQ/ExbB proton channel family protein n=1 Tax=Thalassobacterium maritimum TaxID=3041265 RepID=A0ABU1B1B9_9BACT|nr:MotA/TolQ/ExbB proton channel family protein [Coraliomargarita sp. SDUM461003]MDQ8209484.1 MotA/TolQ/ExbB proton channel family protein [Coraliomargarita sp. SDUM461003]
MSGFYGDLREFFNTGGPVLVAIAGVTLLMWTLLAERYSYFRFSAKSDANELQTRWKQCHIRARYQSNEFRNALISSFRQRTRLHLSLITGLIAICPLLGILGTVTGMIDVFEVLSIVGTGNARELASGVSRATLPTMAGLVAALSGVYFRVQLAIRAEKYVQNFSETLEMKARLNHGTS